MSDWYSLGVTLMVPPSKLEEIQKSSPQEGIQRWRINLLQYWLNSTPSASWRDIVAALEKIGHHTLSARLREKYQYIPQTTLGTRVHNNNNSALGVYPMHACSGDFESHARHAYYCESHD